MTQYTINELTEPGACTATDTISVSPLSKENERDLALVAHFFRTLYHFFSRFDAVLKEIPDPREKKKQTIRYLP